MEATIELSVRRKVNDLGMIMIPLGIREKLEIEPKQPMKITIRENQIIITKYQKENNITYQEIVRKIDELGRIVLPYDMRVLLCINPGDELGISIENNSILLIK